MTLLGLDVTETVGTSAGMFALWRLSRFAGVTDLEEWEDEVADEESLAEAITEGALVPVNIGGDGAYQFTVRGVSVLGSLTEREARFRLVSSQSYLLVSDGLVALGGLEAVGEYTGADRLQLPLDSGRYAVQVHLIDWKAEPGALGADGKPAKNALGDFVIEICRESPEGGSEYRQSVVTFTR
ncbi:hypothetical protein BJP40_16610 [Streptomyces sp. CC53]|uniref:hypothetical protein n=1 Tax=Streptomyces sp. CC53 TaxID=1906740 RepID=UPI0008DD7370|nr:hypothetical protein [Streptomyces sp. CC53]OII65492.1 hypothetical protein BJP40_16610 [Streptomyces sp. CC53]